MRVFVFNCKVHERTLKSWERVNMRVEIYMFKSFHLRAWTTPSGANVSRWAMRSLRSPFALARGVSHSFVQEWARTAQPGMYITWGDPHVNMSVKCSDPVELVREGIELAEPDMVFDLVPIETE